ncbi:MAG: hypothetical protein ACYC2G_01305 [Gemmatimonadaceae bacterium]
MIELQLVGERWTLRMSQLARSRLRFRHQIYAGLPPFAGPAGRRGSVTLRG